MSLLAPNFLARLANPELKTVLMVGCGGGFDFVHGMILYPELKRLGKKVIIGSYSFGDPLAIRGAEVVRTFRNAKHNGSDAVVVRCNARCMADPRYGPEVGMCGYLDETYPEEAPHSVYAYYGRDYTPSMLTSLYTDWCTEHSIDGVLLIDGGSDSLMAGDECGLGDPIEDCVSLMACSALPVKEKIHICVGVGCDRFNDVCDAATLRAIGELTQKGGYLGCLSLEPSNPCFQFYEKCIEFLNSRFSFRSVIATSIVEAGNGHYGYNIPDSLRRRVGPGELYLWPLMSMLWAFDPNVVVSRSLLAPYLKDCKDVPEMYAGLAEMRNTVTVRDVENLPLHRSEGER